MTNEQILKKAIEKAVKGGIPTSGGYKAMIEDGTVDRMVALGAYYNTIFSHDFAKAFWGKGYICSQCLKPNSERHCILKRIHHAYTGIAWRLHLQQMVVKSEPLKYIERFL